MLVCENHRDKAWPDCGCGAPGMLRRETVETDFGVMAVHPRNAFSSMETLNRIAERRYARGEDLSTLSTRVMTRKERLGG